MSAIPKYTDKQHDLAKSYKGVLFKWEMDKRYVEDENDRICIQMVGHMNVEKARKIWEILNERTEATK